MQSTAGIIIGALIAGLIMGLGLILYFKQAGAGKKSAKKDFALKLPLRAIVGLFVLMIFFAVFWVLKFSLPSLPFLGKGPLKTFNEYPIWVIASKNLAVYREMKIYPDRIEKQLVFKKVLPDQATTGGNVYELIPKEVAPRASLVNFNIKPKIIIEDPLVLYEADQLKSGAVTASWTVPNSQKIVREVAATSRSRKPQTLTSPFLERFTTHWPTFAQSNPLAMWETLNEFSQTEMQKNAKLVMAGKTITVSKDILDIAAIMATGTGILDALNLASEVYSIGTVMFGEDTGQLYDYAGLALTGAGILKSGVENKELLKATYQTGILAIKQGQGIKAAASTSKLAKAMEKVTDNSKGASALENAGLNIAGTIVDYAVINQVVATNKFILFEMAQQAQMTMLSSKLVELWKMYERGALTEADAKQIMELETLFFTVQQDELRVRKEYLRTQQGVLDTAFSLVPVAGKYSARTGIKEINKTMKLGQDQLTWRVTFWDKVYNDQTVVPTNVEEIIQAEKDALTKAQDLQNSFRDPVTSVLEPGTAGYNTMRKMMLSAGPVATQPITPSVQPTTWPEPTRTAVLPTVASETGGNTVKQAFSFTVDSFPATLMGYPKTKTSSTAPAGTGCQQNGVIGYLYAEYSQGSKTYSASVVDYGTAAKAAGIVTGYPACLTSILGTTVSAASSGATAGYTFYTMGGGEVILTSFVIIDRYMVTMTTLISGNSENKVSDLKAAMTELVGKMFSGVGSSISTTAAAAPAVSGGCQNVNLGEDYTTYYFYKSASPCSGYSRIASSGRFSVRCNSASSQWREFYVKEVSTGGASALTVKASLGLTDHARFFSECSGTGVKSDNYVFFSVLGSDPRASLAGQCNRAVNESDWPQCVLSDAAGLGSCGVAKCTTGASCNLSVNTSGKDKIYLVLRVSDAWMADIEGSVSNLSVCPK